MPDLRTSFPCCVVIVLNVSASEKCSKVLLKGGLLFWHRQRPKKACFGYNAVPLIARIFTTPVTYVISGLHCTKVCTLKKHNPNLINISKAYFINSIK